jgi:hypothetical protein
VEVVVRRAVAVDLLQGHRGAEERVPAHREVHAPPQGGDGLGVEATVKMVDGPVELLGQPRAVEDQGAADRAKVVDDMEDPGARSSGPRRTRG